MLAVSNGCSATRSTRTGESGGSKLGLFGSSDEEEGVDVGGEDVDVGEEATEVDVEDEEAAEDGGSSIGLIIGLLFLLIVATVVKKVVVDSEPEEYEEVELSEYEN
ncbi:hypothetical protein [Halalkalicoccus salilacus]|uniref:hypothetical protein n=1 Tax=Halalkalicoccus sp. GCM10025704 TaxID=3252662 RepID=UPI00360BF222